MPIVKINDVNIFWELTGDKGEPLILVHGSWGDHHTWDLVTAKLAKTFRVLTFDRRGHSQSERPMGQGYVEEDISDLIELINHFNYSPVYAVGSSFGAGIVLKTAARRPDLFRKIILHEPPLFGLLKDSPGAAEILQTLNVKMKAVLDLIEAGRIEQASREFIEKIVLGPGAWDKFREEEKNNTIYNAPTWYDEMHDPQSLQIDLNTLQAFKKPVLLSQGSESPPYFPLVIQKLKNAIPQAELITIKGAGHVPQSSHPEKYAELIRHYAGG
jgi:pimeloyl-ACP methyl ester carboxylesterase